MDRSEYVKSALQVIESEASPGRLITAARVGLLLRRSLGGPRWQDYGFRTLKDFFLHLEQKGLLRLGETERGAFAVQLEQGGHLPLGEPGSHDGEHAPRVRPLRTQWWLAFAVEAPKGRRFLNKASGEVRMGLKDSPAPETEWLEIEPIDGEVQRGWAREFLRDKDLTSNAELLDALSSEDWYRAFSGALRRISSGLVSEWNRQRSSFVAAYVRQWCRERDVDPELAFKRPFRKDQSPKALSSRAVDLPKDEESMRKVMLEALATAPTDWLLDLPIPAKYIFRVLNTRHGRS